jgi:hypothetical protein
MNKEQQELLDAAYENYSKEYEKDNSIGMCLLVARLDGKKTYRKPDKEMFVGLCTSDKTFSEKWGLKIEERKLNLDERAKLHPNPENFYDIHGTFSISNSIEDSNFPDKDWLHEQFDKHNIPTKLITITYNDKTIESYE